MRFPYPLAHRVPLFLAPMAGVSEAPFRRICRSFGADVVVSEFLSCEGLRRGIKSAHAMHLSNVMWHGFVACTVYLLAFTINYYCIFGEKPLEGNRFIKLEI